MVFIFVFTCVTYYEITCLQDTLSIDQKFILKGRTINKDSCTSITSKYINFKILHVAVYLIIHLCMLKIVTLSMMGESGRLN